MVIFILLVILYIYLGDKANQFCKKHILHLETAYVYDIGAWISNRAIWGLLIGWITIPISIIMWLLGVRG